MVEYVNLICMQALDTVPFFVTIKNKYLYSRNSSKDRIQLPQKSVTILEE